MIANPLFEEKALDPKLLQQVVEESLKSAEDQNISGKDITPFVLEQIVQKTGGASLEANIALIQNNARVGAGIARAYQNL